MCPAGEAASPSSCKQRAFAEEKKKKQKTISQKPEDFPAAGHACSNGLGAWSGASPPKEIAHIFCRIRFLGCATGSLKTRGKVHVPALRLAPGRFRAIWAEKAKMRDLESCPAASLAAAGHRALGFTLKNKPNLSQTEKVWCLGASRGLPQTSPSALRRLRPPAPSGTLLGLPRKALRAKFLSLLPQKSISPGAL